MDVLASLLRSRKFWIAVVGALGTITMDGAGVSPEVWAAVDTLLMTLIASIAWEDGKRHESEGNRPRPQ